jgi:ElaB/YqjD/DUF883 family membrane-anchored ribosome-binding protein
VDDELEVIREQMEETRESLAHKIEELETQILENVHGVTDTVTSAVDGAKEVVSTVSEGAKEVVEKVSETVESVKESLSISRYVEEYPWASVGVAVATGFVAAQMLPSSRSTAGNQSAALPPASWGGYAQSAAPASSSSAASPSSRQEKGNSWSDALSGIFHTAATTVESLAVGTLMGAIKDLVTRELPKDWQSELTRMVDEVTTRLGGKVLQGNPLHDLFSDQQRQDDSQQCQDNNQQNRVDAGPCV